MELNDIITSSKKYTLTEEYTKIDNIIDLHYDVHNVGVVSFVELNLK